MSIEIEENETIKLRRALSSIAKEVQKFHDATPNPGDTLKSQEMFDLLLKYKNKLKLKQEQIARLQNNLRTACTVAKTLTTAKSKEVTVLQSQLNDARDHYWALEQQHKQNTTIIATLKAENETLRNGLQSFVNFIEFGYKELQNICNEPLPDISILKRLQKIVHCCCQYSANQANQSKKCSILENRNKFMITKISILEKQLELISNELQIVRDTNRSQIQKGSMTIGREDVDIVHSEVQGNPRNITELGLGNQSRRNKKYLDLTRHLSSVRKLLQDQENLINDLCCLSKEINPDPTMD